MKFGKKGHVAPVQKKDDKNLVKKNRPISLLPFFDRIIHNSIFNYFISNKHFTPS